MNGKPFINKIKQNCDGTIVLHVKITTKNNKTYILDQNYSIKTSTFQFFLSFFSVINDLVLCCQYVRQQTCSTIIMRDFVWTMHSMNVCFASLIPNEILNCFIFGWTTIHWINLIVIIDMNNTIWHVTYKTSLLRLGLKINTNIHQKHIINDIITDDNPIKQWYWSVWINQTTIGLSVYTAW